MYVLDATPLIYLAKAEQLALLGKLSDTCLVPEQVHSEVVTTGIEEGYPDARRIARAIEEEKINIKSAPETPLYERLQHNEHLTDADCAVLAMAAESNSVAVMDEQYGRDIAAAEEIQTRGTAYLVLQSVSQGNLTTSDASETIDDMIAAGWYCSPSLYSKIQEKLRHFE